MRLHHIFRRILEYFNAPAEPVAPTPKRRIRVTCEFCGKNIAIVASNGRLWRHKCSAPAVDLGPPPPCMTCHGEGSIYRVISGGLVACPTCSCQEEEAQA